MTHRTNIGGHCWLLMTGGALNYKWGVGAQDTPDETAQHQLLKQDMDNALLTLTSRECGVLRLRYGLDDGEEKTLEEIGQRFQASLSSACAPPPLHHLLFAHVSAYMLKVQRGVCGKINQ